MTVYRFFFWVVLGIAFQLPAGAQSVTQQMADSILREGITLHQAWQAREAADALMATDSSLSRPYRTITYAHQDSTYVLYLWPTGKRPKLHTRVAFPQLRDGEKSLSARANGRAWRPHEKTLLKQHRKLIRFRERHPEALPTDAFWPTRTVYLLKGAYTHAFLSGNALDGSDTLLIGIDHLWVWKRGKLIHHAAQHQNVIAVELQPQNDDPHYEVSTMHVHSERSPALISSTDVASLLQHRDRVNWPMHFVFSKEYVSVLLMEERALKIMTPEEFDAWQQSL
ncbi:MAG: hypothetical protein AAGB22_00755 [Bacteroidota bacterium]